MSLNAKTGPFSSPLFVASRPQRRSHSVPRLPSEAHSPCSPSSYFNVEISASSAESAASFSPALTSTPVSLGGESSRLSVTPEPRVVLNLHEVFFKGVESSLAQEITRLFPCEDGITPEARHPLLVQLKRAFLTTFPPRLPDHIISRFERVQINFKSGAYTIYIFQSKENLADRADGAFKKTKTHGVKIQINHAGQISSGRVVSLRKISRILGMKDGIVHVSPERARYLAEDKWEPVWKQPKDLTLPPRLTYVVQYLGPNLVFKINELFATQDMKMCEKIYFKVLSTFIVYIPQKNYQVYDIKPDNVCYEETPDGFNLHCIDSCQVSFTAYALTPRLRKAYLDYEEKKKGSGMVQLKNFLAAPQNKYYRFVEMMVSLYDLQRILMRIDPATPFKEAFLRIYPVIERDIALEVTRSTKKITLEDAQNIDKAHLVFRTWAPVGAG